MEKIADKDTPFHYRYDTPFHMIPCSTMWMTPPFHYGYDTPYRINFSCSNHHNRNMQIGFSQIHTLYSAAASLQPTSHKALKALKTLKTLKHSNTQNPKNSPKCSHPHPLPKTQALWVTHRGSLNAGLYVCPQWQQSEAIGTHREDYKGYNTDVVRFIQ